MRNSHGQSKPVLYEQGSTQPKLDPITLEVVRNKLDGIANEMQSTLLRSSFSTVVKEGLDATASPFTADGETLSHHDVVVPPAYISRKTCPARLPAIQAV